MVIFHRAWVGWPSSGTCRARRPAWTRWFANGDEQLGATRSYPATFVNVSHTQLSSSAPTSTPARSPQRPRTTIPSHLDPHSAERGGTLDEDGQGHGLHGRTGRGRASRSVGFRADGRWSAPLPPSCLAPLPSAVTSVCAVLRRTHDSPVFPAVR